MIHAGGTLMRRTLRSGEQLKLDTGCLVALQPTVTYDIQFIGGFKNTLFGGEGLFFATVTGPGEVWLQAVWADARRLTRHNESFVRSTVLIEPEEITYKSFDGARIQGWLMKPMDWRSDRKYRDSGRDCPQRPDRIRYRVECGTRARFVAQSGGTSGQSAARRC